MLRETRPDVQATVSCRMPTRAYSMHMGAGALLSRGLLQGLDDARFKRCVHSEYTSGAAALVARSLSWEHVRCMARIVPSPHAIAACTNA